MFRSSTGGTLIKRVREYIVLSTARGRTVYEIHMNCGQCTQNVNASTSPKANLARGCVTLLFAPHCTLHTSKLLGSGRRHFREPGLRPELYVVSRFELCYHHIRVTVLAHLPDRTGQDRQTGRQADSPSERKRAGQGKAKDWSKMGMRCWGPRGGPSHAAYSSSGPGDLPRSEPSKSQVTWSCLFFPLGSPGSPPSDAMRSSIFSGNLVSIAFLASGEALGVPLRILIRAVRLCCGRFWLWRRRALFAQLPYFAWEVSYLP